MADPVVVRTRTLSRDQLAKIAGDPRLLRYLEDLGKDVTGALPVAAQGAMAAAEVAQSTADDAATAAGNAQSSANNAQSTANGAQTDASSALGQLSTLSAVPFLVLVASPDLTNERVLTAGVNITLDDAGPGLALTVDVTSNPAFFDSLANVVIEVSDNGTSPQLGFFGAVPVVQPTTAIAPAAFVAGAGVPVTDASTFDGYTIGQIAAALRALGILA